MKYIIYSEKGIIGFTEAESKDEVVKKLGLSVVECGEEGGVSYFRNSPGWYEYGCDPDVLVEIIDINELPEISSDYDLDTAKVYVGIFSSKR